MGPGVDMRLGLRLQKGPLVPKAVRTREKRNRMKNSAAMQYKTRPISTELRDSPAAVGVRRVIPNPRRSSVNRPR